MPRQQFDTCYVAGYDRPDLLSEAAAAMVAWDDAPDHVGPRAVGHHWSLPTLTRSFEPSDIATLLREPRMRVLSYIEFARSMGQEAYRFWYPYDLPAQLARAPLAEALSDPMFARVSDNLITRQLLWGDTRVRPGRFVDAAHIESLAADAIAVIDTLGAVGVVEAMDVSIDRLTTWLGAPVDVPHINETASRQVPGLLRSTAEAGSVRRLLDERSRVDLRVWEHVARKCGIDDPQRAAADLVDERLAHLCSSAFFASFSTAEPAVEPVAGEIGGWLASLGAQRVLVVQDRPDRVRPSESLGRHQSWLVGPDVTGRFTGDGFVATTINADLVDVAATVIGHEFDTIVLTPSVSHGRTAIESLLQQCAAVLGARGRVVALTHSGPGGGRLGADLHRLAAGAGLQAHGGSVPWTPEFLVWDLDDGQELPAPPPGSERWRRYDWPIDRALEGDSRARLLGILGDGADVLELGASNGRMTREMVAEGRRVVAVEFDAEAADELRRFADEVVVGDLEDPCLLSTMATGQFDVILASDVLEHLRDPLGVVRRIVPLLRDGGRLVLSVPNVAHADVRLSLLGGRFDYTEVGLLDSTHIHLFTLDSLRALIAEAGLHVLRLHRVGRPIGETEIALPEWLRDWGRSVLGQEPEAATYQWLVECVVKAPDQQLAGVSDDSSPGALRDRLTRPSRGRKRGVLRGGSDFPAAR